MIDKNEILEAFNFRHATKEFDINKKISDEDIEFILKTGILSPSSFGMEQWKFVVVEDNDVKKEIRKYSWDQVQMTSCSHLLIILAKKNLRGDSAYVEYMINSKKISKEIKDIYRVKYANYVSQFSDEMLTQWSMKQCYIAGANMMTTAAMIGIDSCPIEGFEKDNVEKVLKIDTKVYELALMIPFGYRIGEGRAKSRLNFDDVVEYL